MKQILTKLKTKIKDNPSIAYPIITTLIILVLILIAIWVYKAFQNDSNNKYYKKAPLHNEIINCINNGADYKTVESSYERHKESAKLRSIITKKSSYYQFEYPLSKVLRDMILDNHNDDTPNLELIQLLKQTKLEYEKTNPYDILETGQIQMFQKIEKKLENDYNKIDSDMIIIVNELNHKNQLVNSYLNKSNKAFRISLIALIVSIVFGIVQLLFQYFYTKPKKTVKVITQSLEK